MRKILHFIKERFSFLDPCLLLCALLLISVSLLMMYGINDASTVSGNYKLLKMQAAATVLGLVAMFFIANFNYEEIVNKLWIPLLIGQLAVMGATLIYGSAEGANKSWIYIFGVSIQTSEFVKLTYIITFSKHLDLVKDKINNPLHLLLLAAHAGSVIGMILLSGDLGVALVYVGFTAIMLYAAGLSIFYFIGAAGAAVVAFPYVWPHLREDQQLRIIYGFHPEDDPLDKGLQPLTGRAAIANGGLFGQGINGGTKYKVLYACENDFAFSSVCEKFGIITGIFVIILLVLIVARLLIIAKNAGRRTGSLICVGIAGTIIIQSLENLGMCMAKLPVVGITLPFISYGGSSILAIFMLIGLAQSVNSHKHKPYFELKNNN